MSSPLVFSARDTLELAEQAENVMWEFATQRRREQAEAEYNRPSNARLRAWIDARRAEQGLIPWAYSSTALAVCRPSISSSSALVSASSSSSSSSALVASSSSSSSALMPLISPTGAAYARDVSVGRARMRTLATYKEFQKLMNKHGGDWIAYNSAYKGHVRRDHPELNGVENRLDISWPNCCGRGTCTWNPRVQPKKRRLSQRPAMQDAEQPEEMAERWVDTAIV